MAETVPAALRLARRLRELREEVQPSLTQRQLAETLGVTAASVASWESQSAKVVPPEDRLRGYALYFAVARPGVASGLAQEADLSAVEATRFEELFGELRELREEATRRAEPVEGPETAAPGVGALGGRFWHFPDGQPIRIVATPMWPEQLKSVDYAKRRHPNYIEALGNADMDATIELLGHIRAENPKSDVRFLTADRVQRDHLTSHLVLLGQGDKITGANVGAGPLGWQIRRMELPILTRVPDGGDREFDAAFVVTTDASGAPTYRGPAQEVFAPQFLRDEEVPDQPRLIVEGYPQLEYDVALFARVQNQMNLSATVTICSGIFSRGTYGAVRTTTDANLRARNEQFIWERFDPDNFWLLMRVPVYVTEEGAETVTPDLTRAFHRLRSSVD